jgi:hypothetical protein
MPFSHSLIRLLKTNKYLNLGYMMLRDGASYVHCRRSGTFSQHGEDSFLLDYFGKDYKGFYVDIGASHPFRISNTYSLYRTGWSGVAVDPIPSFNVLYRLWRKRDSFVNIGIAPVEGRLTYFELIPSVLSTFNAEYADTLIKDGRATLLQKYQVKVEDPNSFLEKWVGKKKIDFLSVDVESLDESILQAIDLSRFRPRLICVEFNSDVDKKKLLDLFASSGFKQVKIIGCNLFVSGE